MYEGGHGSFDSSVREKDMYPSSLSDSCWANSAERKHYYLSGSVAVLLSQLGLKTMMVPHESKNAKPAAPLGRLSAK